jgi:Kef-type K+ transport system membrane component KefB/nucleotide-binding universal stress UspA family protein
VAGVPALSGDALFLLLLQVSLILVAARLLGAVMTRIGQPAVIGELLAGIVLGPSLLGWLWPHGFAWIFPADPSQVHLLETLAWIGLVLLMLVTGLETDVRLLRRLGRAALTSSGLGMAIPFAAGFLLGFFTPDRFIADPSRRILFASFLATAMSISAMPVIAKILMDLKLTKRNIGVVILSAGVVDDTTGWLILSLIAGIAGAKSNVVAHFGATLLWTALFLLGCRVLVYPLARVLFRLINDRGRGGTTDLAAMVVIAFLLAAASERIGIHAVFGAFVAGCLLRQVPTLRDETRHRLEAVTMGVFAPIFLGLVGLKVDLRTLGTPGMLFIVLAVATAGKVVGCTWGALLGKMRFWEALSVGVAMNARGAMELVVALIGLTLGILNPAMYAIIVMTAITTSFLAPIGLRLTMRMVPMTAEEKARIDAESQRKLFDRQHMRALALTAGGSNALAAAHLGARLVDGEGAKLTVMHVETAGGGFFARLARRMRPDETSRGLQQHLEVIRSFAKGGKAIEIRKETAPDAAKFVRQELASGYGLLLLGAGEKRNPLRSSTVSALLEDTPCHMAIVRGGMVSQLQKILVPTDGSFFSRAALELGILYAEESGAELTVLYSAEPSRERSTDEGATPRPVDDALLQTLSPQLLTTKAKHKVLVRESPMPTLPVLAEAHSGQHQMLLIGAEYRAVEQRLSVGYDIERVVAEAPCMVAVVVPRISVGAVA